MELAANEIRMLGNLDNLNIRPIRSRAADLQPATGQDGLVFAVEFVAVAMALADLRGIVNSGSEGVRLQLARPRAQAHRASQFINPAQLAQLINDAMRRAGIELARVCLLQSANVAGKLNASRLHAQANAKVWDLVFPRVADGIQHAFNAALAKSAGNQNAVKALELHFIVAVLAVFGFQAFSFHPGEIQ